MNKWQKQNKEQVKELVAQFEKVANDFSVSSGAIKEIATNTKSLTSDNSNLSKMIKELQSVMIEDTHYKDIVNKLTNTIEVLNKTTGEFEETTNKLNMWIKNEKNFKQSTDILIGRLKEIEKIKDINGEFWKNTEINMNKGVSIIQNASNKLNSELQNINAEFYERLNNTLQNLDNLIQRIIVNYRK